MRGSAIRSERLRGTCNDKEPRPQADLSSQRRELLLHCRWNESQISLLNHRNTRPRLRRHRQWIDSVDLQQLADPSATEAVSRSVTRDALISFGLLIVLCLAMAARISRAQM